MSVVETLLVFLGIPLGFVLVMALIVYGRSQVKGPNRYRPGKPWNYAPVWYLPQTAPDSTPQDRPALESGAAQPTTSAAAGGASGEW
jgi:hypothetical protein